MDNAAFFLITEMKEDETPKKIVDYLKEKLKEVATVVICKEYEKIRVVLKASVSSVDEVRLALNGVAGLEEGMSLQSSVPGETPSYRDMYTQKNGYGWAPSSIVVTKTDLIEKIMRQECESNIRLAEENNP